MPSKVFPTPGVHRSSLLLLVGIPPIPGTLGTDLRMPTPRDISEGGCDIFVFSTSPLPWTVRGKRAGSIVETKPPPCTLLLAAVGTPGLCGRGVATDWGAAARGVP